MARTLFVLDGLAVELRERLVDGLLEDGAAADPLVDDAAGDLALAEAGHLDLRTDGRVGGVEARLQLLERDLDGQLDPGRVEGLDGTLHFGHSTWGFRGRLARAGGPATDDRCVRAARDGGPGSAPRTHASPGARGPPNPPGASTLRTSSSSTLPLGHPRR